MYFNGVFLEASNQNKNSDSDVEKLYVQEIENILISVLIYIILVNKYEL